MKHMTRSMRGAVVAVSSLFISLSVTAPALAASGGSVGTWQTSPNSLLAAAGGSSAVTYNGYVYVLGGSGLNGSKVSYAKLNADGSVGSWTDSANTLPHGGEFGTASVYGGYVYYMGGYNGSDLDYVQYAKLNSDGSVGSWTTSGNNLTQAEENLTSVAYNGYLYALGGAENSGPTSYDTVYYAKLNGDGSVGSWTTSPHNLPQAISSGTAITANGYVYVMGGYNYNTSFYLDTVYYAKLSSNGSVGTWSTSPSVIPRTSSSATAVTANGYAYYMGGYDNGTVLGDVYNAKLSSNGSVGSWTTSPNSLPTSASQASAVAYNSYVYVMGGYDGDTYLDGVFYAQLTPEPSPASSSTTSSSSSDPSAPDTGHGKPAGSGQAYLAIAVAAAALGAGSALLRRQQQTSRS